MVAACAQDPKADRARSAAVRSEAVAPADSAAVHQFVQGFYDWYTGLDDSRTDPVSVVLASGSQWISGELAAAIQDDMTARTDSVQFRRTLDFDPFLWSQDPCARYEVERVVTQTDKFLVTMRPVCAVGSAGQRYQTKAPAVEVSRANGKWSIQNVVYSKGSLISMLCSFAQDDARPDRRPKRCG